MNNTDVTPPVFSNPFMADAVEHQRQAKGLFRAAMRHDSGSVEYRQLNGRANREMTYAKIAAQLAVAWAFEPKVQAERATTVTLGGQVQPNPAVLAAAIDAYHARGGKRGVR